MINVRLRMGKKSFSTGNDFLNNRMNISHNLQSKNFWPKVSVKKYDEECAMDAQMWLVKNFLHTDSANIYLHTYFLKRLKRQFKFTYVLINYKLLCMPAVMQCI